MLKRILSLLFLFVIGVSGTELDDGISAYQNRGTGSIGIRAESKYIDQAIQLLELASTVDMMEEEATLYLLRSYYYKGTFVLESEDARKAEYNKGKKLGEKMISKYPESADIRYWYLTCLGKWAEVYGILTAAKEGVAGQMKHHSEKMIELDDQVENGGGYFMLGAVHYKSPYIPLLLSWPDNDEAIRWLTKAVDTGRATPVQKNYLARALFKDGQKNEAIRLVKSVASTPPNPDFLVEERFEISEAKKLLNEFE